MYGKAKYKAFTISAIIKITYNYFWIANNSFVTLYDMPVIIQINCKLPFVTNNDNDFINTNGTNFLLSNFLDICNYKNVSIVIIYKPIFVHNVCHVFSGHLVHLLKWLYTIEMFIGLFSPPTSLVLPKLKSL